MNNKAEDPNLWNDAQEAQKLMRERQQLDESIGGVRRLEQQLQDNIELIAMGEEEGDQAMVYHAQRSYYEALLRAGVKIWMYEKPFILHSKSMTIDDEVAVIGSSNMDMRSFGLNLEISMLVRGSEFVHQMRAVEAKYRSLSHELTLEEWEKQPLRSTVLDNLARLTSALQ